MQRLHVQKTPGYCSAALDADKATVLDSGRCICMWCRVSTRPAPPLPVSHLWHQEATVTLQPLHYRHVDLWGVKVLDCSGKISLPVRRVQFPSRVGQRLTYGQLSSKDASLLSRKEKASVFLAEVFVNSWHIFVSVVCCVFWCKLPAAQWRDNWLGRIIAEGQEGEFTTGLLHFGRSFFSLWFWRFWMMNAPHVPRVPFIIPVDVERSPSHIYLHTVNDKSCTTSAPLWPSEAHLSSPLLVTLFHLWAPLSFCVPPFCPISSDVSRHAHRSQSMA